MPTCKEYPRNYLSKKISVNSALKPEKPNRKLFPSQEDRLYDSDSANLFRSDSTNSFYIENHHLPIFFESEESALLGYKGLAIDVIPLAIDVRPFRDIAAYLNDPWMPLMTYPGDEFPKID